MIYWGWEGDLLYSWFIQGFNVSKAYANETTFAVMVERTTSAITLKTWVSSVFLFYYCLKFTLKSSCCSEPGIQVSLSFFHSLEFHMMHTFSRTVCILLEEELFTRDSQHNLFKLSWNILIRMFKVSDLWQWINSPWGTKVSAEDETWRISQGILKCTRKRLIISSPQMSMVRKMELHRETVITIPLLYSSRKNPKKEDLIWRNKKVWNLSSISFPHPRNAGIPTHPTHTQLFWHCSYDGTSALWQCTLPVPLLRQQ